ncbi:hypothetical protein ACLI08_03715 [Flavobacterium sp. RNTU_13]|uniref:hypothetical protein n=1 Tax=Flavobacterium sp. RNTU_13 TaxID=3375145 RepID=UPI0039875F72
MIGWNYFLEVPFEGELPDVLGAGGLFPLPPPDGFPVVLGPFTGLGLVAIKFKLVN